MTTQREVIGAFLSGETQPRHASNFRMHTADGGLTAYLVSDGALVFAVREPMGQHTVFMDRPFYDLYRESEVHRSMTMRSIRLQHRKVTSAVRSSEWYDDVYRRVERPLPVTEYDDLEHLHP